MLNRYTNEVEKSGHLSPDIGVGDVTGMSKDNTMEGTITISRSGDLF